MNLIWATRGRAWGFRFLLDGGYSDPLPTYEKAFAGTEGESRVCRRTSELLALRFPDPESRCDHAGRVIPHDIVLMGADTESITEEDAVRIVWQHIGPTFAAVWDLPHPPDSRDIRGRITT